MDINPKILKKVEEKTSNDLTIRAFLLELLNFESENNGWFTTKYSNLIGKYSIGSEIDEISEDKTE